MKRNTNKLVWLGVLLAGVLGGCTVSGPNPELAIGMPNPATVYCLERGGTLDIQERTQGTTTYCVLGDGRRVEEWAFYRENHPQ